MPNLRQTGGHAAGAEHSIVSGEGAGVQGQPVQTYRQLVQYLVQQGGTGTCVASLPFVGANQVVFKGTVVW